MCFILIVLLFIAFTAEKTRSSSTCWQFFHNPKPGYHLTKECAASTMRTVASSNALELDSCTALATEKNAFAFTYLNQTEGRIQVY